MSGIFAQPRLPIHDTASAPEASRPRVEAAIKSNGFLPNLIGVLAGAPTTLETYQVVGEINSRTSLSLAQREVVQLTAAYLHGCDFCTAGHSAIGAKRVGWPAPVIVALQAGQPTGDPALDALQRFVKAVINTRGNVSDDELAAFLAAGHTKAQVLEVILGISLATLCNFANTLARSPINPELRPYGVGALGS